MDRPSSGIPEHQHRPKEPLDTAKLYTQALGVLHHNDLGQSTRPAPGLYPHQWLWDSCFIAIGLRHIDVQRAKTELISLLRGQWTNGMFPHQIFSPNIAYHAGHKIWRSDRVPHAPKGVQTSGFTQSPMLAEAVVRVGEKLPREERLAFYAQMYPALVRYHQWLYGERDPNDVGLVTLIHAHESGMDNIPFWMSLTKKVAPIRVRALHSINQEDILDYTRKDRKFAAPGERSSAADIHTAYHFMAQWRRLKYDLPKVLKPSYRYRLTAMRIPLIQDVVFNAILIRANECLRTIAVALGETIASDLRRSIEKAPHAFETLFMDDNYWSRDFRTGELIQEPTIGTFLALYAGSIPKSHAEKLVAHLQQPNYWPMYGIATTPTDSSYFKPRCYWQGPVWVNTNWLIAEGLERYGYKELAERLREQTIQLVARRGMYEYFSPLDGSPAGTDNFSWTAALVLDMLARKTARTPIRFPQTPKTTRVTA